MSPNSSIQLGVELAKDQSTLLGLSLRAQTIAPGDFVPRADTQSTPQISFAQADANKTYLVVCVDPDAPYPSANSLSPILHWIQSGFTVEEKSSPSSSSSLQSTNPVIAEYIGAAPPSDSEPHRYLFLLYEQPVSFEVAEHAPPSGETFKREDRMRYDLDAWENRAKLSLPVAANYFTCN